MSKNFAIRYVFAFLTFICTFYVFYLILWRDNKLKIISADSAHSTIIKESISDEYSTGIYEEGSEDFEDFSLKNYPNFPANFYSQDAVIPEPLNKSCGIFPKLDNILFNNLYWQTLSTQNGEYQLLGAYWDVRPKNKNRPTVRILTMITPLNIAEDIFCQFWFKDKVVFSEKSWNYFLWHDNWGGNKPNNYKPYLLSCKLPKKYLDDPPIAVSLVTKECDQPTNILKITYHIPKNKRSFAVCVKGLDFHEDISTKLIEWIELLRILDVDKIYFYELHIHDEIRAILEHYQNENLIELTPITLPGHYPNEPYLQHLFLSKYRTQKRLFELISYNDCFLKHMYEYKYIILLDIDEIIMPFNGTYTDLIDDITSNPENAEKSSYNARNVYFFDDFLDGEYFKDIPSYMHMLQHVYRMKDVMAPGLYIKSFHNTDLVLALHNHYPIYCVEACKNKEIDPKVAKLQHYRKDCVSEIKKCDEMKREKVLDTSVWRFKNELIENVNKVIKTLKISV